MKDTLVKILLAIIGGAISINCLLYGLIYRDMSKLESMAHQIEINIVEMQGQLNYLQSISQTIPTDGITSNKFFEILEIIKTWNVRLDSVKRR